MITTADILKASILIVDDQVAHSSLLEQILTGAGYVSVTTTNNPREVCDLHRKNLSSPHRLLHRAHTAIPQCRCEPSERDGRMIEEVGVLE